ncbi:Hint domain-containing protein [Donghicola tyrosinivorans]|uniref:Hint domain-containing protein n=1 Tax=Donghicola tyrosinivorans TaxID=1652492 RepID=A0A2T0WGL5_9RHOB|nr:Hint domain-containing protein [Donghicola tyrosinivorans]PRY85843.1 Hint domain-containing protein [Donghicola tyrosinivorans]
MATTFNAIYLGQLAIIDPDGLAGLGELNTTASDANLLKGLTFGGIGNPLLNNFVSISAVGNPGAYYDQNNSLGFFDQFTVNNTWTVNFDATATYSAQVTFIDGTTTNMTVVIFQEPSGHTFWAPSPTAGANQTLLESEGIRSLKLIDVVSNTYDGLTTDRQVWNYALCFCKGTLIETSKGQRPIETLTTDDHVLTIDHGFQQIRWIGHKRCEAKGKLAPVHFATGTIGNTRPLKLSPQHRVMLEGWQVELVSDDAQALTPAINFVDDTDIRQIEGGTVDYYHLMLDRHEIIFAEGAPAESFHPGDMAMRALDLPARREILEIFPELADYGSASYGSVARPVLKPHETKLVISQVRSPDMRQMMRAIAAERRIAQN